MSDDESPGVTRRPVLCSSVAKNAAVASADESLSRVIETMRYSRSLVLPLSLGHKPAHTLRSGKSDVFNGGIEVVVVRFNPLSHYPPVIVNARILLH